MLQNNNQPVFPEFLCFLEHHWPAITKYYHEKYKCNLPNFSSLKNNVGEYDVDKICNVVISQTHLADCLLHLFSVSSLNAIYSRYGSGILSVLYGRMDIIKAVLNPKLHSFDAIFLKYILTQYVDLDCCSHILINTSELKYFERVSLDLSILTDDNYQNFLEWDLLSIEHQRLQKTIHMSILTQSESNPKIGDRCLMRLFPLQPSPAKHLLGSIVIENPYIKPMKIDEASNFFGTYHYEKTAKLPELDDYSESNPRFLQYLTNPLMTYLMGILMQIPVKNLNAIRGQLGPLLRATFGTMPLFTLPLNNDELKLAHDLWSTQPYNPLIKGLQVYHLEPLPQLSKLRFNQIEIFNQGFINVSRHKASAPLLYQGSHNTYKFTTAGSIANHSDFTQIFDAWIWNTIFGPQKNPQLLTANTPILKHKTQLFYPITIDNLGLYCHLSLGPHLIPPPLNNQINIASGTCLLGNAFVGITEDGQEVHLLDRHEDTPTKKIIDIKVTHDTHPEELLYEHIQKTLASLYREAFGNKAITFHYYDVRGSYFLYLISHYRKGNLSKELVFKGMERIDERHQLMVDKLSKILNEHRIKIEVISTLGEIPPTVIWETLEQVMHETKGAEIDEIFVRRLINFLANNTTISKPTQCVYQYLLTQELDDQDAPLLKLSRLDFVAQLAVLNKKINGPLLVALLSIEDNILNAYETLLGTEFGSVIHFLWLNPINLRDDERHNRWFFMRDHIQEANTLIREMITPIQNIIAAQAKDSPPDFVEAFKTVEKQALRLNHLSFFEPKKDETTPKPSGNILR